MPHEEEKEDMDEAVDAVLPRKKKSLFDRAKGFVSQEQRDERAQAKSKRATKLEPLRQAERSRRIKLEQDRLRFETLKTQSASQQRKRRSTGAVSDFFGGMSGGGRRHVSPLQESFFAEPRPVRPRLGIKKKVKKKVKRKRTGRKEERRRGRERSSQSAFGDFDVGRLF